MDTLEQLERATKSLQHLLAGVSEPGTMISSEWIAQAQQVLGHTASMVNRPQLHPLKSSPQVQLFRKELLRLRDAIEHGQNQLMLRQRSVESERARLSRVQAFTKSLEGVI
jgi:hypothetical protein